MDRLHQASADGESAQAAFQRRLELRNVPIDSPLRHLGYFIVIEALLTHAPQPGDSADTLSRQLQTKLLRG